MLAHALRVLVRATRKVPNQENFELRFGADYADNGPRVDCAYPIRGDRCCDTGEGREAELIARSGTLKGGKMKIRAAVLAGPCSSAAVCLFRL